MKVSTKELRIQPGKIIDQVTQGEEVTVTFRGKALAKIIPLQSDEGRSGEDEESIFGMWGSRNQEESVEELVRNMRQERRF